MEDVVIKHEFWRGKRVFITGHTGFKGAWLCLWLQSMGAQVQGYSLDPPTEPNLYSVANVADGMVASTISDIRDANKLIKATQEAQPDVVFHLAAQPLVRHSYTDPVETYAVNIMGTVNLLEAVRATPGVRAVVNITTDKCYENREWVWGYREHEPMGGFDPYSSSKGCSELVTAAYRKSFLDHAGVPLASARAGNVIGGGDWAPDRLIPDFLRAIERNETLKVRFPEAVRPWQHVLEPLSGYLILAERLFTRGAEFAEPWNFGPDDTDTRSVRWVLERLVEANPNSSWGCAEEVQPHEANYLRLDSSKARVRLNWQPRWRLATALSKTITWHQAWRRGEDMHALSLAQIADYQQSQAVT